MSLAEQVIVLSGTWVSKRKVIGRSEVLECETAPTLSKKAVRAEIGDVTPFSICVNQQGCRRHLAAIRIGCSLIVWDAPYPECY